VNGEQRYYRRYWTFRDGGEYSIEWLEGEAVADILRTVGASPTGKGPRRLAELVGQVRMDRQARETGVMRLPMMLDAWLRAQRLADETADQ
jgi:hypothetical protein